MRGLLIAQQPGTQTVISAPTRRAASDGSANDDANSNYREERLARFRRCCRFRSFHLAFWLLLSFARAALVHLNAIGGSLAADQSSRAWLARVKTEVDLWSDLAKKLSATQSVPDVVGAYQQCVAQRMQMAAEDGRRLYDDCQKITQTITRSLSNGWPAAST